jgi:putative acetyltransferase
VTALLPFLLLSVLALCGATAFGPRPYLGRLRWLLRLAVLLCWVVVGAALWQSAARTAVALVSPGAARRIEIVESAGWQALTLLFSLGGPPALVTALALWTLHGTRPGRRKQEPEKQRQKNLKLAELKAGEAPEVARLLEEYALAIDLDPTEPALAAEREGLPGPFAPPQGRLLVARVSGQLAGCLALKAAEPGCAELKLLFVRAPFRHAGVARALAEAGLAAAAALGYGKVRGEVRSPMREALQLLRDLGFQEVPVQGGLRPGATWMERKL